MDKVLELAKMIDHSLLHPTMTDKDLKKGCELAVKYDTASVCIKPYAVWQAKDWLAGTDVLVGTVIGFPHGNSSIKIKVEETLDAIREGAVEIDMVVNIGKVLSGDWDFIKAEMSDICKACHDNGAILKVIFENDYLDNNDDKIALCEICTEVGVDYAKTSSGYGFVKGIDGKYSYKGATYPDLRLMRKHCGPEVKIKAAGGVRTLDDLLAVKELGVSRVGATATAAIIDEAKERFGKKK